jgi:hypothetical protein
MAQWKGQQQEIVGGYGNCKTYLELKKVSGLKTCNFSTIDFVHITFLS